MGSSPISVPSGSPGANAGALAKVREAIKILQAALPDLPPGSEPHKQVLSAIQGISKHVSPSAEVPGVQQSALRDLTASAGKNAMLQQVMQSMGSSSGGAGAGGAAGLLPGGPPAVPPPMAA